jgi:hypothetical protein
MENRILSIGSTFPAFEKTAVVSREKGMEFATFIVRKPEEHGWTLDGDVLVAEGLHVRLPLQKSRSSTRVMVSLRTATRP